LNEYHGRQHKDIPARLHKETARDFLHNLNRIIQLGNEIRQSQTKLSDRYLLEERAIGGGGEKTRGINQNNVQCTSEGIKYSSMDSSCGTAIISTTDGLLEQHEKLRPMLPSITSTVARGKKGVKKGECLVHLEDNLLYSKIRYASRKRQQSMGSLFSWPKERIHNSRISYQQQHSSMSKLSSQQVKRRKTMNLSAKTSDYDTKGSEFHSAKYGDINYWNVEYGDDIDEVEFEKKRKAPVSKSIGSNYSHSNNAGENSNQTMLSEKDSRIQKHQEKSEYRKTLEEMITRAWERAIHASSTTIAASDTDSLPIQKHQSSIVALGSNFANDDAKANVDNGNKNRKIDDDTVESEQNDKDEDEEQIEEVMQRISPNQVCALMKCKALNISFDPVQVFNDDKNGLSYRCQSCGNIIKYTSREGITSHLFGTDEADGCCWRLIDTKHSEIIEEILEHESLQLLDGMIHILFEHAKQKKKESQDSRLFNWIDVMSFVENELKKSISSCNNRNTGCSIGTLKVHPDILPIAMNKDIFEIVLKQLIGRYGYLPRG